MIFHHGSNLTVLAVGLQQADKGGLPGAHDLNT